MRGCCLINSRTAYIGSAIVLVIFVTTPAWSELTVTASPSLNTNSNIFKVSHASLLPSNYHRSDVFYNLQAEAQADVLLRGWRAELDASATNTWFQHNTDLNTFGYRLAAKVTREARNIDFDGRVNQSRQLSSFTDIRSTGRNVQTLTLASGKIGYKLLGDFSVVGGLNYQRSTNSSTGQSDYDQVGELLGLRYKTRIGNTLAFEYRHRSASGLATSTVLTGSINPRLPLDFDESRFGLSTRFAITDFVILTGDGGYLIRHDHAVANSNFGGVTGQINLRLVPRDSIRIDATASRQLELQNFLQIEAVRVTSASLATEADITATTLGRFTATLERRSYRDQGGSLPAISNETQKIYRYELAVDQSVSSRVTVSASLRHEVRNSSDSNFNYKSDGFFLALHISR